MNILYVGPYRLANNHGYLSYNNILYLTKQNKNIVSRPVFDGSSLLSVDNSLIDKVENREIKNIDMLIQHLPIDALSYTTKIEKHIFIPILNNKIPNNYQIEKLHQYNSYGTISCSYCVELKILEFIGIKNIAYYPINIDDNFYLKSKDVFDIGIYNQYHKYYSIIDIHKEKKLKKLIAYFVRFFYDKDVCLVLFLINVTQKGLDAINNTIKEIYQKYEINNTINKIVCIPIENSMMNIKAAHNTGQTFVALEENIHLNIAQKANNQIVFSKEYYWSLDYDHPNFDGIIENETINLTNSYQNTENYKYSTLISLIETI